MALLSLAHAAPATALTAIGQDLGLDDSQKGFLLGTVFAGMSTAVLAAGALADRWGFRLLLAVGAALLSSGLAVMASAGGLGQALAGAFVLGLGAGTGDALVTPIACAMYADRRTRATNLLHSFYPIGLVLTVTTVLWLMSAGWSWRWTFAFLAAGPVPYVVAVLVVPLPTQTHEGPDRLRARRVIRHGAFWLLLAAILLAGVAEIGPSAWLPAFVEQATGGTRQAGGLGLVFFGLTMAAGRLGTSALVGWLGPRRMFIAGAALSAACLLLSAYCAAVLQSSLLTVGALTVLGLGVAGMWPTIVGCAGDKYPRAGASMYSLLAATGNFGGVIGPAAIGLASGSLGLGGAMAALAAAPVLGAVCVAGLLRRGGCRRDGQGE